MANGNGLQTVVAIAILLFLAQNFGFVDFSSITGKERAKSDIEIIVGETCADPSVSMTVGPMSRYLSTGTSMSSENARYWRDGIDQGTAADSASVTVGFKEEVAILYGYQSSTHYTDGNVFTVPCQPFSSASMDSGSHELWVHDVSPSITVTNADTGNNNDGLGAANESIGSGETGKFRMRFETSDTEGWSPKRHAFSPTKFTWESFPKLDGKPETSRLIAVVEINGTIYDEAKVQWSNMIKDNSLRPAHYNFTNTDSKAVTFYTNSVSEKGKRSLDLDLGTLSVQAKSGENPYGTGLANAVSVGTGDILVSWYPEDWETHTELDTVVFGTDQNDGTTATFAGIGTFIAVD